jgi:hypothetical protein
MATSALLSINPYTHPATAHEDLFNGNLTTDIMSLANYGSVIFVLTKGPGATGTATITVESCDDTSATTSTAVAFNYAACTSGNTWGNITAAGAAGFTTTAGANQCYMIEIRDDQLSGSDKYVRAVFTESANDPVDGAVISIGMNPKFPADPPKEMIT